MIEEYFQAITNCLWHYTSSWATSDASRCISHGIDAFFDYEGKF